MWDRWWHGTGLMFAGGRWCEADISSLRRIFGVRVDHKKVAKWMEYLASDLKSVDNLAFPGRIIDGGGKCRKCELQCTHFVQNLNVEI